MRKPFASIASKAGLRLAAVAALLLVVSCQSSGPTTVSGTGSGPGGTTVIGSGSTNQPVRSPYGLPTPALTP